MVWLMNGTTVLTTSNVGANPGSPWHVTSNTNPAAGGNAGAPIDHSADVPANLFDHPILFDGELIF
jgi:hypothetical protein